MNRKKQLIGVESLYEMRRTSEGISFKPAVARLSVATVKQWILELKPKLEQTRVYNRQGRVVRDTMSYREQLVEELGHFDKTHNSIGSIDWQFIASKYFPMGCEDTIRDYYEIITNRKSYPTDPIALAKAVFLTEIESREFGWIAKLDN